MSSSALLPHLLFWVVSVAPSVAQNEKGLVVRLTARDTEQRPPYKAILTGAEAVQEVPLNDDGRGSDVRAGDDVWSGETWSDAASFTVSLETADGVVFGGEVSWPAEADNRDVVMTLEGDGLQVVAQESAPPLDGGEPSAAPAPPRPGREPVAEEGSAGRGWWAAGLLALLLSAIGLVGLGGRRRQARALRALRPWRAPRIAGLTDLPGEDSLHRPEGEPPGVLFAHLVAELARSGPVVVIAPAPTPFDEPGPGPVLWLDGPPRLLVPALRVVMARNVAPPALVALVDPPDAETIENLAQNLPDSVRALFVVKSLPPLPDVPSFCWRRVEGTWQAEPTKPPADVGQR